MGCKRRTEASEETTANTLIWTSSLLNSEETDLWCLSHPTVGTLLRQFDQINGAVQAKRALMLNSGDHWHSQEGSAIPKCWCSLRALPSPALF